MSAPFLTMGTPDEVPDWSFCAEEARPGFVFAEDVPELDKLTPVENSCLCEQVFLFGLVLGGSFCLGKI